MQRSGGTWLFLTKKSYGKKNIVFNCKWNSRDAQDTIAFKLTLQTAEYRCPDYKKKNDYVEIQRFEF